MTYGKSGGCAVFAACFVENVSQVMGNRFFANLSLQSDLTRYVSQAGWSQDLRRTISTYSTKSTAFDATSSPSRLRWSDERRITDMALRGVLVRGRSEPISSDGWEPGDLAYIREEIQAALLAWLQSLPCPVINRFTADLWFRPQRSL